MSLTSDRLLQMGAERIAKLQPRELEVLRLVARRMTSKQIAIQLGISVHTVNGYIADARKKLDGISRQDAATMVAEHDQSDPQKSTPELMRVDDVPRDVTASGREQSEQHTLRDVAERTEWNVSTAEPLAMPPNYLGPEQHDLITLKRLALVAVVAAGLAILVVAALPMSESYQRLANMIEPFQRN
jgi:DNA-binding CsgD family transcriptional regulator